jgi:hypothetical protein
VALKQSDRSLVVLLLAPAALGKPKKRGLFSKRRNLTKQQLAVIAARTWKAAEDAKRTLAGPPRRKVPKVGNISNSQCSTFPGCSVRARTTPSKRSSSSTTCLTAELVRSVAQGELSALERGMHALGAVEKGKHGKSVKAYAEAIGRPERSVAREVAAASVLKTAKFANVGELLGYAVHLAEIHAAPSWLWPALRMLLA